MTPTISLATDEELPFIESLRRRDSHALGFLSSTALLDKIRRGRVWVARVAGQPVGFVLHGATLKPEVRVFQLAVDPAFRGQGLASRMVTALAHHCRQLGVLGLSLRCRERLAANAFWQAAGFVLHDVESASRGHLFVWVKHLAPATGGLGSFCFHTRWHSCPSCGRDTCDSWKRGGRRTRLCASCAKGADE